jgi:N-acetylglucosamine-6-sulfatase
MASPNVLVVMTDDARTDDFDHMRHLHERIGANGTELARFYAPGPLCAPNRSTFLTGQYPHNTGVTNNRIGVHGLRAAQTLPVWLHAAGYTTSLVGKYINGVRVSDRIPPGWDNWMVPGHGVTYDYEHSEINDNGRVVRLQLHSNLAYSLRAQRFIRRHAHRPWFQWVSFVSPHGGHPRERVNAPPITSDAVGRVPTRQPGGMGTGPFVRRRYRNAYNGPTLPDGTDIERFWNDERLTEMRWLIQRRRDSLSDVDDQIDALMSVLTETRQRDRTFVIVVSDNGFQYGEHGLHPGKDQPYEESVRIPCFIRGPGVRQGYRHTGLAGMMDLAPTILRMAGAEGSAPAGFAFDGRSVLGRISDPSLGDEGHDRTILLEAVDEGADVGWLWRGLVTSNRKYAEFVNGPRLLFDRDLDPHEETNLVQARPDEVRRLHEALSALERCAGDTCRVPNPL